MSKAIEGPSGCVRLRPESETDVIRDEEVSMGKRSKTGVLKRLREVKKAERAALKREELRTRKEDEPPRESGDMIATEDDLAGYGFPVESEEEEDSQVE